jgi:salicylate hydroxylase
VLAPQKILPHALRSQDVTVWMGEHMHGVQYPVCGGEWLNLVMLVASHPPVDFHGWDLKRSSQDVALDLRKALRGTCTPLQDLARCVEGWRVWSLCERGVVQGAHQMAQGRVALLGDAAHPMLPYLAQGAGMAVEDAQVLALAWADASQSVPQRLQRYAEQRWQRNAHVQRRAQRNGAIFHATGLVRAGRDMALRALGARLMDIPWLYGAQLNAGKP